MVSVRLVTADSYQAKPLPQLDPSFSEFRGSEIKHVPVIRIFGTTSTGEKTCLHVHGAFPYLFVPYTGEEDPQILAYRLAASLDAAINVSLGSATSNCQHIYSIQRVSGTPFYGYHRKEHQFFKIYFYNPAMIKRAADLLQNGSILNQSLQPHEAHINYILQFMMDYNIYGMSFVNLRSVKHRRVTQSLGALTSSGRSVSSENSEIVYLPVEIERQSTCELEIDAQASDILNRLEIDKNMKLSPGLAAIWDEERARRAQAGFPGGDSQLVNPKSPTRPPFHPTDNDIYQNQRLTRRLLMISQGDESTLSTPANRSVAYAAEVPEGENLLDASRVPDVSVDGIERIYRDQVEDSLEISSFMDTSMMPGSQNLTQDNSILEADDMPLVDLLAQLAGENEENSGTVDADSLLGSQVSVRLDENDKIEQEDEDEEEDVADLNLTSLELDSLGSFDRASGKQESVKISGTEKSESNALIVSPFSSPWESPSRSPASVNDIEEHEDSGYRMPQYDGAGDVSPGLLCSDDEDTEKNAENAKELDRFSEFSCAREVTNPRKASRLEENAKETPRTNLTSEMTHDLENTKSAELLQDSTNERRVSIEGTFSEIADICVGHYCVVGYEPFDRMLEMGNDLIPDFADMQSSMELGILSSSEDSENCESMGEINTEQEIVLETVLNGDPCFTESADLDKSDVTELHDQYVSLMGNALLPDLPGIDNDLDEASSSEEGQFGTIDKAPEVSSPSCYDRVEIISPDSLSSSENVAPNIPEFGFRGFPKPKVHNSKDDCEPSNCKEQTRLGNDTADHNCNVVATWAELQNLQIFDKSENEPARRKNRKFRAGPRSMKRRGARRFHNHDVTSQVFHENTRITPKTVSNDVQNSPADYAQHSVPENLTNFITSTPEVEKTIEEPTNDINNDSERLSCSSRNEESYEDFSPASMAENIDPDDRSAVTQNTLFDTKSQTYQLPENFVVRSSENSQKTSGNHLPHLNIPSNIDSPDNDSPMTYGTSHYSSKRSENLSELEDRHHRHCVVSRGNKILRGHVFTNDELWIVHKKIRRKCSRNRVNPRSTEAVCTSKNCKFPVVFLRKIVQGHSDGVVIAKKTEEIVVTGESSEIVAEEILVESVSLENLNKKKESSEYPVPPIAMKIGTENVEVPKQKLKKVRRRRKVVPASMNKDVSGEPANIESSTNVSDTKFDDLVRGDSSPNGLLHPDKCQHPARLQRRTYNTRRRPIVQNVVRKRQKYAKKIITNKGEDERKKKVKAKPKEPKLPGIPGIPGIPIAIPKNRRRPRKNVLVKTEIERDDVKSQRIGEPTKESSKNLAIDTSRKTRKNGIISIKQNVEISPDKSPGRRCEEKSPMSPIPKKNTSRERIRKNSSTKCLNLSSTTEKLEELAKNNEPPVVREQKPSPELTLLLSMLKQAKKPSMRTKIKLLMQKRLNEQCKGDNVEMEFRIKRYPPKVVCDEASKESTLGVPIINEPLDRNGQESGAIQEDKMDVSVVSDASSFETVTDTNSDDVSERVDASIASLKNVKDSENRTLVIEYSDSSADILDNEASVDSAIVESHNATEFSNNAEDPTYDTDRYENAIKEANFFAGKDYSIDAVSDEIPTCLFEEDSNSNDKRPFKKTNHDFEPNSADSPAGLVAESVSELSIDPRDLDVYDVQSLTSSSSISNLNEANDRDESSQEIFNDYNTNVIDTRTNLSNDDGKSLGDEIPNARPSETISRENANFDSESPPFEALSPEPRIDFSVCSSIQSEFTVQPETRVSENQNLLEDSGKNTENGNLGIAIENSSQLVDSLTPENSPAKTQSPLERISTKTPESSPKSIPRCTHKKIISPGTFENSNAKSISQISITINGAHNGIQVQEVEEKNERPKSTINSAVAQIVTDLEIEPGISEINENEELINAEESTNFQKTIQENEQFSKDAEKKGQSTLVGADENISNGIETEMENCMYDEDKEELSSNSNEDCELRSFVKEEGILSEDQEVDIGPTKIIEECEEPFESSENGTQSSSLPKSGEIVAEIPENVSKLSTSCNNGKNLSERLYVEIPLSGNLFMSEFSEGARNNPKRKRNFAEKLAEHSETDSSTFEQESECAAGSERIEDIASMGTQLLTSRDDTEFREQHERPNVCVENLEQNEMFTTNEQFPSRISTTGSENEQQKTFDERIVEECKDAEEQGERSMVELEATTFLSEQLPEVQMRSKIEKTGENPENFGFNIRSKRDQTQKNTKSNSVDINKNDVEPVPEADDCRSRISKKQMECRPISIELKHIDLSKIGCLAGKSLSQPEDAEIQESSDDDEYKELSTESESVDFHETDTTDETIGNPIDTLNSRVADSESFTGPEVRRIMRKRVRKYRRKMPKMTQIPERRSVRICAEMTLKLSQKEGSSTTTIKVTTAKEGNPEIATATGSEEKREENLEKIIAASTRPEATFLVEEPKTQFSQELVLAEQSIMDENLSPTITKRRVCRRKIPRTNSQEISLPTITDENTAPIFDTSTRRNSRINVQEIGDDLKSSRRIGKNVAESMSPEIEVQPGDFMLKMSEPQANSENVIPSKRRRAVRGRFSSISKRTKLFIPTKSAPNKNSRGRTRVADDSISTMKNTLQGLNSSTILSPPICSLNNAPEKCVSLVEKSEESLIEESEVIEEPVQQIKEEFTGDNEIRKQIGSSINVITKIPLFPDHDLAPENTTKDKTKLSDPPVRRKGRPRRETIAVAQKPTVNENLTVSLKSASSVRKRGRPRKYPINISQKPLANRNFNEVPTRPKARRIRVGKKRGRPRKLASSGNSVNNAESDSTVTSSETEFLAHQTSDKSKSQSEILTLRPRRSTSRLREQENSNETHTTMNGPEKPATKIQLRKSERPHKRNHFEDESANIYSGYYQDADLPSDEQDSDVHARKHYKKSEISDSQSLAKLDIVNAVDEMSLSQRLAWSKADVEKIEKPLEASNSEGKREVVRTRKEVSKLGEKGDDSGGFESSLQNESFPNSHVETQLQKPIIRLEKLSRNSLKRYGIVYSWSEDKFVKMSFKGRGIKRREVEEDDEDFLVPAYDGAADLSSSEEEDPDVTIAREEKRVCTYSSSKKSVSKGETVLRTPSKRKLETESGAFSPKRQALDTKSRNETETGSLNSPNRTSTLKTPGRNAAKYSPLKIIVTSPKVRKDIPEPRQSCSGKLDDEARPSSSGTMATTPSRRNSRLRDNLLRRRINSVKSTLCDSGDEGASSGEMRSKAVGELDEIRFTGEKKDDRSRGSSRNRDSGIVLQNGKDVRKKLLFLDQDLSDNIDELSTKKVQEGKTELREIFDDIEGSEEETDMTDSMRMDAVAGPSGCPDNPGAPGDLGIEIEVESDEDICNVTFTQFIETQKSEGDATPSANPDTETGESNNRMTMIPKFKPPSRDRVLETMEEYGIPKFRNQEPFFSESVDVPKQKELAHKILKVPGKGVEFLPQFVSSLEEVTGISRWRKMWLNEFYPSLARTKEPAVKMALASNEKVLITPIALPPSQKQVKDWVRARDYLIRKKAVSEESKFKAKEQTVIEIQAKTDQDENFVPSPQSSGSSVIEPSPEKTLVSEDLERTGNTSLKSKLARRGLLKSCVTDRVTDSQELNDSKEKSFKNSTNVELNPSLLDVLQKSRLFRDQEASRHLGISCGQIEFLSDSTRSNITNENLRRAKALIQYQYLTIMCLEIHVVTREDLLPDAQHDPIAAIFYSVQSDVPPESSIKPLEHGVIVVADSEKAMRKMYYSYASTIPWKISFVNNEEALLNALVTLITRTDPEILIGWEIETLSWGYVFQRASTLGMNLLKRVSRIPATQYKWEYEAPDIEKLAEVKLPGRIVLDIWRIMRHETALLSYTFESVMHHVLNERIPCPSFKVLTDWWNLEKPRPCRWRVVEHYSIRVLGVLRILDQLDIIGRTSELARLFGIQFFEVFSRGSQFRVESVMLRLAKPLNYIAVSPSSQQRASMRAMEALPLILEPESMLYSDPLIVLDFQSLYPSIIIAHNLCFSTCLGRIEHIGQPEPFEFGAYTLRVPKRTAMKLQGKVNFTPCGVAFVKPEVRLGILPRMLMEILETRFMVKKAMKDHDRNDKTLQRALHSRQLGLKFLANVTYGYTAANFSGRMPCIEVGDSVISKSKETLERAIKLVEATPKWGARVVYGDTDSLFILVPGKSKDEAFVIGNEIADAVTASNIPPIKLKFEKVLYPAILQTKKRYCGYMYETPDQGTPTYLAKGIETVRRDGCPAVSKILEKTLKILFETKDVSLVKKYVTRQLDKVLRGKVSIQDLTFAKEFRGLKGYKAKACVPTLELTRRLMRKDPRAVPRTSERVRYVIVAGAPNQALIHCVRSPWELIHDPGLRPNAIYYVTRVIIPPLNRCLNLMGVDVNEWYKEMPHRQILDNPVGQPSDKQKLTIFQYFGTIVCVACGQPSNKGICTKCLKRPADTLVSIHEKLRWLDRTNNHVTSICQSCVGRGDVADCGSLDCPMLYRRAQAERELSQAVQLREIIRCGNNLEF